MANVLLITGPHGVGKGTQAYTISRHYGIPHISTGQIFRDMVRHPDKVKYLPSKLVKTVKSFLEKGVYVSDEITNQVVEARLFEKDCKKGFILDGYPRTLQQAEFLKGLLKKLGYGEYVVINLVSDEDTLVKRQLYRVVCENHGCGASYNTLLNKPKKDNICDRCGSRLVSRSEDSEEGIRKRNEEYEKKARPVVLYYKKIGKLIDVDGNGNPKKVFSRVKSILDKTSN